MNNSENVGLEQDLTQRRANCTIWAHLLFWWIVPFGWILSTYKMRFGIPAYVMLGAICLAAVTGPTPDPDLSPGESFSQSFQHGQKYGLAGSIIGTAVTLQKIQESRKTLASQKSVGAQA